MMFKYSIRRNCSAVSSPTAVSSVSFIATHDGAYFHGLDRELGCISKGKLADLVVLNRDPLRDIRNTLDIAYVMKGGRLYDANTLDQVWPEKRVYAPLGQR